VGAGVFGLSTALELNKRGYTDITVVDRFVVLIFVLSGPSIVCLPGHLRVDRVRIIGANNARNVIVGAGVFGLSTALELNKRGYTDITVVDRFVPPSVLGVSENNANPDSKY
jgi:glycine/D-amino acid oxidase-like deaminating enzyme